jgi:hypothetical protein
VDCELLCGPTNESKRLSRLLEELLQALEMSWYRRTDAAPPISDRVRAAEPDEFRQAPLAEPHARRADYRCMQHAQRVGYHDFFMGVGVAADARAVDRKFERFLRRRSATAS